MTAKGGLTNLGLTSTLFGLFAVLLILSVPVSIALGLASIFTLFLFTNTPMMVVIQKAFEGVNSFSLMAIPFFILAGNVMSSGGVSKRLVDFAESLLGRITGGLALVATAASAFFGAISGSAPATTAAIGSIMIKPMEERGYDKEFVAATVTSSGTIGLLIPPSITMILYGVIANVSIGKLFLGGILPGILMTIALMTLEYVISKNRNYKSSKPATFSEIISSFKNAIWALLMPVIILGGIYSGVFTPTESAVVAVAYGIIVAIFIYKEISFKELLTIFLKTGKSTAVIMYLMATASIFSYILASEQIPQILAQNMLQISTNPTIILLLISGVLLVTGTFLSNAVSMVLLTPIFYPIITQLGIDPIFFGVLMVLALSIGQITPPVGLCLFIACDLADISLEKVSIAVIKPLITLIIVLLIVLFIPSIVTIIPNTFL